MTRVDTVIENGRVVTEQEVLDFGVAIDDGEIAVVGDAKLLPEADRRIDANGNLILPGVVDPHFHVDEVPENRAGTMPAESAAAALGGITTFIDFAWQGRDRASTVAEATLIDGIDHKRSKEDQSFVDYSLHGVLHRETRDSLDQISKAIEAGVTSFKMFMSNYEVGVSNGFVDEAFDRIARENAVAAMHTEDPSVCESHTDRLKREGKGSPEHYPGSRPDYSEAMAAEDAVRIAREKGVKYYGVHTSCRDAAEVIEWLQADQSNIRAETCTHYTALTDEVYGELGNLPILAPPLRTQNDVDAMFEYLSNGVLSVVSTDHSVYHREYKESVDNWWESPFGANSAQYSLPVFHEVAINQRNFSYPFLMRVMCANPAQTFGLPNKGTLEPGTDADLIIFDPNAQWTIDETENASNSTYSPYDRFEVTGSVEKTFIRGNLIVDDGKLQSEKKHGRFIEREIPNWEV